MEKFCHIKLFDLQLEGKKILQDFSLSFDEKNLYAFWEKVVQVNHYY